VADDDAMHEEMQFHVDMQTEKNIRNGMSPEAARRAALLTFGGAERWKESARAEMRSRPLEDFVRDLRFTFKTLRAQPGFAVATIATIALAVAASVTVFTVVDSVFMRALPVAGADRLVHVWFTDAERSHQSIGSAAVRMLRSRSDLFDAVVAHDSRNIVYVRANGSLREQYAAFVGSNYFSTLGVRPLRGRYFTSAEDSLTGQSSVAVLSDAMWEASFARDPKAVGAHIQVQGADFTVIGIAPADFKGISIGEVPNRIWFPLAAAPTVYGRFCDPGAPCRDADGLARLAPGVNVRSAQAELSAMARSLSKLAFDDDSVHAIRLERAVGIASGSQAAFAGLARLLWVIAGVLLLIACANLSGLLIARGIARQSEFALRVSLGANRTRIVRQLLTESLVLGIAGGLIGTLLSVWAARGLMGFFARDSEGFQHFYQLDLNTNILAFACGVSLLTVLMFGLVPALLTARRDSYQAIKGKGGPARGRAGAVLVCTQVALAIALLAGAALLSRSFARMMRGQNFNAEQVALLRVRPAAVPYDAARSQQYVRRVAERIKSVPGVENVAFARGSGLLWDESPWQVTVARGVNDTIPRVEAHFVSPGFFAALQVPMIAGREFDARDTETAPPVAVIGRALAEKLWPGTSPLDHDVFVAAPEMRTCCAARDQHGKRFRVVGIASDYRVHALSEKTPLMIFVPFWQNALGPEKDARFAVRAQNASALLPALRRAIDEIDPAVPVTEMMPMSLQVDAERAQIHLGQNVLLAAALLALFLSGLGVYGTIAFLVAGRTREIGIRVAVGAGHARVIADFVRQGLLPAFAGAALGLIGAIAGARLLAGWLVGVKPTDFVAFAAATVSVVVVTCVASYLPARRAARVDPMTALRAE
jgi:predicted permease